MTADPRELETLVAGAWHKGVGCKHPDTCPNVLRPTSAERAAARVLIETLAAAGWSLLPAGGGEDLYVVIKSVPGREPEIMADIAADPGELNGWLAALRYNPADRLATYTGYRLTPVDTPGELA